MESERHLEIVDAPGIAINFGCACQSGTGLIGQTKAPDQQVPAAVIDIGSAASDDQQPAVARVPNGLECSWRPVPEGLI